MHAAALKHLGAVCAQTLFLHGGLITQGPSNVADEVHAFGHVPARADRHTDDVHTWLYQLHQWKQQQMAEWKARPLWSHVSDAVAGAGGISAAIGERTRGGEALQRYAQPGYGASVIMARHLNKAGMPLDVPERLMTQLNHCGVRAWRR